MTEEKPKPIDVDQIDLERLKEKTADLPGLIEYAHSVGGFSIVPTEQGVIKGKAMQAMKEQSQMQLDNILEQMKVLAKQAQEVKDRVDVSNQIYEADIKFEPVIGQTYHLYEKENGDKTLSLIGPHEWGRSGKNLRFISSVRLLADHTWKVVESD